MNEPPLAIAIKPERLRSGVACSNNEVEQEQVTEDVLELHSLGDEPIDSERESDQEMVDRWLLSAAEGQVDLDRGEVVAELLEGRGVEATERIGVEALCADLRAGGGRVAEVVMEAWILGGHVHRLTKLADELVRIPASEWNPPEDAGKLMLNLAISLGVLRPARAERLLDRLERSGCLSKLDPVVVKDARRWTAAGLTLADCGPGTRVFWNNRLRHQDRDWSWETVEARLALAHLAQVLPTDDPAVTELFQGVVPGCWWDLWQTRQSEEVANSASEKSVLKPTAAPRRWTVVVALVLGVVLGAGAAGLGVAVSRGLGAAELLRRVEFGGASSVSSAPANSPALGTPIALASEVATEVKAPLEAAKPEALDWRQTRLARIRSEFPALERLHKTLAQGSMREAGGILKGSSSLAGMGSASYQALLEWAMLELPQDAEVRRAVIRYYLMSNPLKDTLPLLEQLAGPGEPHRGEIREMASILLTLNERVLSPEERSRLEQVGR